MSLAHIRWQIRKTTHQDEHLCVEQILADSSIPPNIQQQALALARQLVHQCRQQHHNKGPLDSFLQEFGLSNNEGIALMCLAESLLRVPDDATANKLIAEKILEGDWCSHRGHSDSLFVNASIWGLMLTGKILPLESVITDAPQDWLQTLTNRLGEPVVRKAMLQAMRLLGNQYVLGSTIESALNDGGAYDQTLLGNCFSFDMLGEGARTEADALRYFEAYANAIERIGQNNNADNVYSANGISIKLSALYPRYEYAQKSGVMSTLFSRIRELAISAKHYNIGLSIDAEEARRLDLSLDIFEALARDPKLSQWQGLGFVLQAYQKRAPWVARWLIQLGEETHRCLMVRLVKGAYWDAEIKYAQEQGMVDYPVFTRKVNTDLCYQHCAQILLSSPQALYPQFATHNAHTLALILAMSSETKFEFQRLHGMGELLYQTLYQHLSLQQKKCSSKNENFSIPPVRIYAPIGKHRELLPYLVRRLLENGANSSFIHRFLDNQMPIDTLVQEIEPQVLSVTPHRNQRISTPPNLYFQAGEQRQNSLGVDLSNPLSVDALLESIATALDKKYVGHSIVVRSTSGAPEPFDSDLWSTNRIQDAEDRLTISSPANQNHIIGHGSYASANDIEEAFLSAEKSQPAWDALGGEQRAIFLDKMADALELERPTLIALITSEAGRTIHDAISEIREAMDFCRYYAEQARQHFSRSIEMPGPTGEQNLLSLHGRGVFLCISPWNFPLAIFTGQIAAALAAGNTAVAKPAESTSVVATFATQLFLQVGIPIGVLQLITGIGGITGKFALTNNKVSGVVFTGSTKTAKQIQQQLANKDGPIVPLIAETGGQNVMIADSTTLPEQLVDDVIQSAFFSAGQRCSALRVLYLQEEIADDILTMLSGALPSYRVGNPAKLSTDIGPVIDEKAQKTLLEHIRKMTQEARLIVKTTLTEEHQCGYFVAPHIFEIESISQLSEEVFGPILHVIRYQANKLDDVIKQINDSGYGLTLGVHSRIQSFSDYIFKHTLVGNTYINRNMIGAMVGTNPFGGCGLSGTGPKAGGPHYLYRFSTEKTRTDNLTARGGNTALFRVAED